MKIETKFNIGDKAWTITWGVNGVTEFEVDRILLTKDDIFYVDVIGNHYHAVDVFESQDNAINYFKTILNEN